MTGQSDTPYLDALRAYAARSPGRFHVPGHKGGPARTGLVDAIGEGALELDIPALTYGIDVGEEPTRSSPRSSSLPRPGAQAGPGGS